MRTTIVLDDDVAAAVEQLRRQTGMGLSEAVNQLIRAGTGVKTRRHRIRQPTAALGICVDVTNVAEALESLDGPVGH